jgi:hypothetical protein
VSASELAVTIPLGIVFAFVLLLALRLRAVARSIEWQITNEMRAAVHQFRCAAPHGQVCANCPFKAGNMPKPPSGTQVSTKQPGPQASLPGARTVLRGKEKP